ncbi:MAG: DUF4238 domain-containing protein [Bacteroidota bacterium]|nr:DUF4238 domain-containing protein [Bacteroidota bacterium]
MKDKKLNPTKDQHTTPKVFLKNFSNDNKFLFKKLKTPYTNDETLQKELIKQIALSKATVIEGFYTVISAMEPLVVETLFYSREIEQHYPKIYELLVNPNLFEFDMEIRSRMLMFFLSLHCRTPKQFKLFFDLVPNEFAYEIDNIKEDYKVAHIDDILTGIIAAHEFKRVKILKITDTSEFITSDNPVLIIGKEGTLKNIEYKEQFNKENIIFIPIDPKHCCVFTHCLDKNGIDAHDKKVFYNKIERVNIDCETTQTINYHMLHSAEKYYFGSEKNLKGLFTLYKLI